MKNIEKYIDDVAELIIETSEEYGDYACPPLYLSIFGKRCNRPCRPECPFFSADKFVKWAMSEVVEE